MRLEFEVCIGIIHKITQQQDLLPERASVVKMPGLTAPRQTPGLRSSTAFNPVCQSTERRSFQSDAAMSAAFIRCKSPAVYFHRGVDPTLSKALHFAAPFLPLCILCARVVIAMRKMSVRPSVCQTA